MSKSDVAEIQPNAIGQSVLRTEDPTLLTGRGEYIADMVLPGMLPAVFVRSSFAHAKINQITVTAAAAVIGAVNDALACFNVSIERFPISPQRVFEALADVKT